MLGNVIIFCNLIDDVSQTEKLFHEHKPPRLIKRFIPSLEHDRWKVTFFKKSLSPSQHIYFKTFDIHFY